MQKKYSFLKDNLALMEIRKHKWIESEKRKKEIGFATAALDWINKYGHTWKIARLGASQEIDIFLEKRRYRRFNVNFPIEIIFDNIIIKTSSKNISLLGVSCETHSCLKRNASVEIKIIFPSKRFGKNIRFKSQILRSSQKNTASAEPIYQTVILFDEHLRDVLRENFSSFKDQSLLVS
ncbi:MAG: PilZ domain-containing protein [Candidatus Omnitrophica bacterium]|nr:PilZ domain-containing protein [Candidatus Omnitrophota bacterium]